MLSFVSTNKDKINMAKRELDTFGIRFKPVKIDLIEIQSESARTIAIDKAESAYKIVRKPLIISDHVWEFPALNNFPGPYMKYMNIWLKSEDFLNLLRPYTDKRLIFKENLIYKDKDILKIFSYKSEGKALSKPQGKGLPAMRIVSFLPDGKSVAQCLGENIRFAKNYSIWERFAKWYLKKSS